MPFLLSRCDGIGDDSAPTQMADAASSASSKNLEEWRLEMNLPKEVDRTNAASPHIANGKQSLHESGLSPAGKPHRQYGVEMLAGNGRELLSEDWRIHESCDSDVTFCDVGERCF